MTKHPVLGVDIGSVSVSLVLMSGLGEILGSAYESHHGMIRETLGSMLAKMRAEHRLDNLGGIACTAGTGSFLDQQARRLGLSGSGELARFALENQGELRGERGRCSGGKPPEELPTIASRCSVFVKTDLSHAQQVGDSLKEICDVLCLGLARSIADTISDGNTLPSAVYFAGGVSRNQAVARHLENLLGCRLVTGELAHLFVAAGACLSFLKHLREAGDVVAFS